MTSIKRQLLQIMAVLVCCLVSSSGFAEMYKWVDEEGKVHYSQSPPPPDAKSSETIAPPPPVDTESARQQLEKQREQFEARREKRLSEKEESMKTQEELAQKKALCEKARARLESWQRPRVDYIEPDGTSRRATEEERQAEIKKSQESIDEFCN